MATLRAKEIRSMSLDEMVEKLERGESLDDGDSGDDDFGDDDFGDL